ncbi:MAG: thiamine phosphate synthase [Micropepsaceae bacterium]
MDEARAKLARHARALNTRHARGRTLPAIVLMTDDTRDADWVAAASALPRGSAVIVRHRDPALRERFARRLRSVCKARHVTLLVADDAALAQRIQADGVHLPEKRIGRLPGLRAQNATWLITTAAHSAAAVRRAGDADAVFVSPVFGTASHPDRSALGVIRFAGLAREGRAVYALGGVDTKTIRRLVAHRIVGIGLIGGWVRS